ncbi:MAG: homoserine kinase [Limisphaerales bacterium]
MPSVSIRVPGSTSNLGPGFDSLGIALRVYNRVAVSATTARGPRITSPISESGRGPATELIAAAAGAFFRRSRQRAFGFDIHLSGDVPIARGLGSSVTLRLGTVGALNELTGGGLSRLDLFRIVSDLEGHPDNAAPAAFGGFTASAVVEGEARCVRIAVPPRFRFVTLIPNFEVPTPEARRLVPAHFSKADAVHNVTHAALITAAFARRDTEALRGAFSDRMHQPYREVLIPQLTRVIRAGERAGAVGGWLSGSGSTIICLAPDPEAAPDIGKAMLRGLAGAEVRILAADPGGFRVG